MTDYRALPIQEIFALKERNALRIAELKETIQVIYQDAFKVSVENLSPAEWMRYQHRMDICRQIRALLEDDFKMLYSNLADQDLRFEQIAVLQATL
jgi:hypothetical protein